MVGNKQLKQLMETPMSRTQFLRYVGIMLLSMIGFGNVMSTILGSHQKATSKLDAGQPRRGFGGGKYGQ